MLSAEEDTERRIRRIEYLLIRVATHTPDALPPDAHELIAEMVKEIDNRPDGD